MSIVNHLNDRKRIYVDELESILDKIEWWEQEYDDCNVPGNRDPHGKKDALEQINLLREQFDKKKRELEEKQINIFK